MKLHDELIADFKAIQKKINDHVKAEGEAKPPRQVRNVLIHQVTGKCDGAIAILENDKRNASPAAAAAPEKLAELKG